MDYTISELLNRVLNTNQDKSGSYYQDVAWIQDILDRFMLDKPSSKVADLSDEDKGLLLKAIVKGYAVNGKTIPDYLSISFDAPSAQLTTILPPSTIGTQLGDEVGMKLESVQDYQVALQKTHRKLEVSKNFLKDLDNKLSKFEAVNIDEVVETIEKYESIGTIEEIEQLIDLAEKYESLGTIKEIEQLIEVVEKYESSKTTSEVEDVVDTTSSEEISTKLESTETIVEVENTIPKVEGKTMSKVSKKVENTEENMTDEELLAAYRELGTLSEIQDLMNTAEELNECNTAKDTEVSELSDKVESLTQNLTKYESIGTTDEILDIVSKYADTKIKMESARISEELNIPEDRVLDTINKMESIRDAEELLVSLFPKVESKQEVATPRFTTETSPIVAKKEKSESVVETTGSRFVSAKHESSDRMTRLAQICAKL